MTISSILAILKIIGIVLLWILGIVLFLILMILFLPFCYRVNVNNKDKKGNSCPINARVNVSYFFHLISAWVIYDKSLNIIIKVFGIPIYNHLRKKEKKSKNDSKTLSSDVDLLDEDTFEEIEFEKDLEKDSLKKDSQKNDSKENFDNASSNNIGSNITSSDNIENNCNNSKDSLFDKISTLVESFGEKIDKTIDKISNWFDEFYENTEKKIDNILDTVSYYDKLFSKKGSEKVIEYLKKKIILILKSIRPRKGIVSIDYGSDDPEKVGKVFEYYSLALPFLPKKSGITISYEENYFKFLLDFKGRIIIGYIAIIGLQVFLNKKVRKFIKLLKREDK